MHLPVWKRRVAVLLDDDSLYSIEVDGLTLSDIDKLMRKWGLRSRGDVVARLAGREIHGKSQASLLRIVAIIFAGLALAVIINLAVPAVPLWMAIGIGGFSCSVSMAVVMLLG